MNTPESLEPQNTVAEASTPETVTAPSGTPSGPSPVQLADDALVTVKVGGQELNLPWNEARQGIQFHKDYTQSKQALAEERRQFEARQQEFATREQSLAAQLEQ